MNTIIPNVQRTTYNVQRTTYNVQRTTYNVQRTTYNVQRTTYNVQQKLKSSKITIWLLMMSIIYGSNDVYGQGINWKLNGNNNVNNNTFLGSTNNAPLLFRTNNQNRLSISGNGNFTFHSLSGTSNALMLLNSNGEATRLNFTQNSNEVLTGNGTWQSINTLVPQYWQLTNAGLYTTQPVVVNNTITATGIQILHKIEADTIKGVKKVDINGNITLGEDGAYKGITAKIEDLNINSKPGYDFNTILNANTNGNVGIGTSNPTKKLDVNGDARISGAIIANSIETERFRTDTIKVSRILPLPGDTLIYFGDSTIVFHTTSNRISWTSNCGPVVLPDNTVIYPICRGFSIGNGNTSASGNNAIAIGNNVSASGPSNPIDQNAMVIGSGVSETQRLSNSISNSLAIGFNSTIPTLFVSAANGANTLGKVGIGCTNPQYLLDVAGAIRAREFRINLSGCDFVFEPNYNLLPIAERKAKVLTQKHLPNIAPALQMQQGEDFGNFTLGLLQNLEEHEHYLYIQNDEIQTLKAENKELKNMLLELKAEIEQLKNK
ncbi:MAG: hypothetical protein ACK4IK_07255 [Bacteroidia bacterium]